MKSQRYSIYMGLVVLMILMSACVNKKNQKNKNDVPTTLEHHSSSISSSSGTAEATASSFSNSGIEGGSSYSYSVSTSSDKEGMIDQKSIKQLMSKEDDSLREEIKVRLLEFLVDDSIITSTGSKFKLAINDEYVIVNKKILGEKESRKYIQLIRDKLGFENSFTYNYNQN